MLPSGTVVLTEVSFLRPCAIKKSSEPPNSLIMQHTIYSGSRFEISSQGGGPSGAFTIHATGIRADAELLKANARNGAFKLS